ncbi:MAG: hypothetical protein SNG49_08230 [Rikenellaceae bacterium]
MSVLLISVVVIFGCLLSLLIGFIGQQRTIGFGWAFALSLALTPPIGLIITMLTKPRDPHAFHSWGCLSTAICFTMTLVITVSAIIGLGIIFLI